jgi:hypothetical protein
MSSTEIDLSKFNYAYITEKDLGISDYSHPVATIAEFPDKVSRNIYYGIAVRNPKDKVNKKQLGRLIAVGRAQTDRHFTSSVYSPDRKTRWDKLKEAKRLAIASFNDIKQYLHVEHPKPKKKLIKV